MKKLHTDCSEQTKRKLAIEIVKFVNKNTHLMMGQLAEHFNITLELLAHIYHSRIRIHENSISLIHKDGSKFTKSIPEG